MQIDHDPNEPKIDRGGYGMYLVGFVVIALFWAGGFYFNMVDLPSVCLGLGTGVMLMAFATEITGNKIPDSWRK